MKATVLTERAGFRFPPQRAWRFAASIFRNVAPFLVLLVIWRIAVALRIWPPAFLPNPAVIPGTALELALNGTLVVQVLETVARVSVGAAIGFTLGALGAIFFALFPRAWDISKGLINYMQAVGEIGWLPVFALWLGFNNRSIVLTIVYTVFFPVFFGTLSGFQGIPMNLAHSVRTLGGKDKDVILEVMIPGALPGLIAGLRTGAGFGWRTVILAEMLLAQTGLGVLIFNARSFFRVDIIIVGMIVAGVLWLSTDRLLFRPLEARTVQRWGIQRKAG